MAQKTSKRILINGAGFHPHLIPPSAAGSSSVNRLAIPPAASKRLRTNACSASVISFLRDCSAASPGAHSFVADTSAPNVTNPVVGFNCIGLPAPTNASMSAASRSVYPCSYVAASELTTSAISSSHASTSGFYNSAPLARQSTAAGLSEKQNLQTADLSPPHHRQSRVTSPGHPGCANCAVNNCSVCAACQQAPAQELQLQSGPSRCPSPAVLVEDSRSDRTHGGLGLIASTAAHTRAFNDCGNRHCKLDFSPTTCYPAAPKIVAGDNHQHADRSTAKPDSTRPRHRAAVMGYVNASHQGPAASEHPLPLHGGREDNAPRTTGPSNACSDLNTGGGACIGDGIDVVGMDCQWFQILQQLKARAAVAPVDLDAASGSNRDSLSIEHDFETSSHDDGYDFQHKYGHGVFNSDDELPSLSRLRYKTLHDGDSNSSSHANQQQNMPANIEVQASASLLRPSSTAPATAADIQSMNMVSVPAAAAPGGPGSSLVPSSTQHPAPPTTAATTTTAAQTQAVDNASESAGTSHLFGLPEEGLEAAIVVMRSGTPIHGLLRQQACQRHHLETQPSMREAAECVYDTGTSWPGVHRLQRALSANQQGTGWLRAIFSCYRKRGRGTVA